MFPTIKKRITGFLLSEEGKMPEHSLLTLGSLLSAAVIGGILATKEAAAGHTNSVSQGYNVGGAYAHIQHTHHGSHSYHASHSNAGCASCGCGCSGCS